MYVCLFVFFSLDNLSANLLESSGTDSPARAHVWSCRLRSHVSHRHGPGLDLAAIGRWQVVWSLTAGNNGCLDRRLSFRSGRQWRVLRTTCIWGNWFHLAVLLFLSLRRGCSIRSSTSQISIQSARSALEISRLKVQIKVVVLAKLGNSVLILRS